MSYCFYCMQPLQENAAVCPFCGKPRTADVPPHHLPCGTVLRDRYLIGAALGEGGFGITYIGRDTMLNLRVAIKEYYPNGYTNRSSTVSLNVFPPTSGERKEFFEKGRSSFLREARTMGSFSEEPGIVNVRDFFEENNTAYIVMEYLDGVTMKTYLKQHGVMRYDELLPMMLPLMRSLQRVHEADLIHRDISPDNIMLVGDRLKLLDFGAARSVSAEGNRSLSVMLKPGYAPEEQYRTRGKQGPWTDVYALCATIYKCITGVTPDDSTERMNEDTLQPPSALGAVLPPAADAAIMRGLAVSAKNRIQSVGELMNALLSANSLPAQTDEADYTQLLDGQYYAPPDSGTDGTQLLYGQSGTDDTQLLYGQSPYAAAIPQPVQQPLPQRPVMPEPVSQRPVTRQPIPQPVQQPVPQRPVMPEPVSQRPVTRQPVPQPVQQPVPQRPVMPEPVSQRPVTRQPVPQPVQQPFPQQPAAAQAPKKKKSKGAVIAVVAVAITLVIAAGVAVGLIFRNNNSSAEDSGRRNTSADDASDHGSAEITENNTGNNTEAYTDVAADDYVPQWVTDYDPLMDLDYDFSLDHASYRMLMPLQLLLDDGWSMEYYATASNGTIAPEDSVILTLQKGAYSAIVELRNIDSRAVLPAFCAVTGIELSDYSGTNASFTLLFSDANNVSMGVSKNSFNQDWSDFTVSDHATIPLRFLGADGVTSATGEAEIEFSDDRITHMKITCTELY